MTDLPGVLGEIAAVAGEEAAIAIASARGGTQVYIPPMPDADHWLCRLIGVAAARKVCEQLTAGVGVGRRVDLPLGLAGHAARVRAKVDAMLAEGRSERDIAIATRYSIRAIRARRKRLGHRPAETQLSLF
jgi:hypothetical protein